jgi:hypothetical protein
MIQEPSFCQAHRVSDTCFIRRRKLTFVKVMVILLQKTVRSIQLHLHDFFGEWAQHSAVASSWCEARLKLKHTAFLELNRRAILEVAYGGQSGFQVRRWKGHRLLGMDSSLIRLPHELAVGQAFGWMEFSNPPKGGPRRCAQARLSVLTDVLNRLAIETILTPWKQCEREMILAHWPQLERQDVSLLDRGFASYELWAQFSAHQRWFVCRCPDSSFAPINKLFAQNQAGRSVLITLAPPASKRAAVTRAGLPENIILRLVTVRLESGQLEVLATNLLDAATYSVEDLGAVYHHRWGIETYYGLLKGRLDLENFSGLSVEAIRQDLHATVFLSNLESILTRPAQGQLQEATAQGQHQAQVNHAVSFHALKSQMIQLLLSSKPVAEVLPQLQRLFLRNPVYSRPKRKVPRQKKSPWRSYNYQRNIKKAVF